MNLIVIAALALILTLQSAAAAPQNIQNANPLNIDLSDPSQVAQAVNNAELDDPKFGGYRPLYPPYFLRDAPIVSQQQQPNNRPIYYDKEYYTRGRRLNEENLAGNVRIVGTAPRQQVVTPVAPVPNAGPYSVLRAFTNFDHRLKPKFAGGGGPGSGSYAYASVFVNT